MTPNELASLLDSRLLYRRETWVRTGTLYVSNSTLKSTATCQTQDVLYSLGYHASVEPFGVPAYAGTCFHEAHACWMRGNALPDGTPADPMDVFDEGYECVVEGRTISFSGYRSFAEERVADSDDKFAWHTIRKVVAAWFAKYNEPGIFPFHKHPSLVEISFAVPLTDDGTIVLTGRIDDLVSDSAGVYYVDDSKTTGKWDAAFVRQFNLSSQISAYVYGVRETSDLPVAGGIITALETRPLPTSDRKCYDHGRPYRECAPLHVHAELIGIIPRDVDFLVEWKRSAQKLAREHLRTLEKFDRIEALPAADQRGEFNGGCTNCEFAEFCLAARPIELVDSMLHWTPYEGPQQEEGGKADGTPAVQTL